MDDLIKLLNHAETELNKIWKLSLTSDSEKAAITAGNLHEVISSYNDKIKELNSIQ